jgi:hypothetical protein
MGLNERCVVTICMQTSLLSASLFQYAFHLFLSSLNLPCLYTCSHDYSDSLVILTQPDYY